MKRYYGKRADSGCVVHVVEDGERARKLRPRRDLRDHSPTGFEWGYGGSGPAQLALALVADATGDDALALERYQDFKAHVVAGLARDRWELSANGIRAAVGAAAVEAGAKAGRGRRAALDTPPGLMRKACEADPFDLGARSALADALEEAGDPEAGFQRLLVRFGCAIQGVLDSRGPHYPRRFVGLEDGRANVHVFSEVRRTDGTAVRRDTYAMLARGRGLEVPIAGDWKVPLHDAGVFRGCRRKREGPLRFLLSQEAEWAAHLMGYGLRYLSQ